MTVSKASESEFRAERNTNDGAQLGLAKNTRKPPSPYDPSPNSLMTSDNDHINVQSSAPTPRSRPTSQDSATSASSAVSRKIAPPVPRKPLLLSGAGDQNPGMHDHKIYSSGQKNAVATTTISSLNSHAGTAPLPRRTPGSTSSVRDQRLLPPRPLGGSGPKLPPRNTEDSQSLMGLMDDDIEGAIRIPSLQPQRQA